jgi:nicotinamidase-related amidase
MTSALVLIDVQKEYQAGGALAIAGFDKAATNISKLLTWARSGNADILHVRHISRNWKDDSFRANSSGVDFADGFEPKENEQVFTKSFPSAFSAPLFGIYLERKAYDQIIICGYTSFLCCDSTSREAFHNGYSVVFAEDAIGEFAFGGFTEEEIHRYATAVQGVMFAKVVKTSEIIK